MEDMKLARCPEKLTGYQSAFRFFTGYLSLVLPSFAESVKSLHPDIAERCVSKLLIICPQSCDCPPLMTQPGLIDHTDKYIQITKNRAGQKYRDFKVSLYRITVNSDEVFYAPLMFANSLMSMSDIQKSGLTGLTERQMFRQRNRFFLHLQQLLDHDEDMKQRCRLLYWRDVTSDTSPALPLHEFLIPILRHELQADKVVIQRTPGDRKAGKQGSLDVEFGGPAPVPTALYDMNSYSVTRKPRGVCLVINIRLFYTVDNNYTIDSRPGSEADVIKLEKLFKWLHFDVQVYRDEMPVRRFWEIIDRVSVDVDHTDYDAFVCCVMSHGSLGKIYTSDRHQVKLLDIVGRFSSNSCPTLKGKPKMFFVQSCQNIGNQPPITPTSPDMTASPLGVDDDAVEPLADVSCEEPIASSVDVDAEPIDSTAAVPTSPSSSDTTTRPHRKSSSVLVSTLPDTFLSYSALPGQFSYRDEMTGSFYIEALVTRLQEGHELMDALKHVTGDVKQRCEECLDELPAESTVQLPCFSSSPGCKSVYLTGTVLTTGDAEEKPTSSN